jgi:hypothetical protein
MLLLTRHKLFIKTLFQTIWLIWLLPLRKQMKQPPRKYHDLYLNIPQPIMNLHHSFNQQHRHFRIDLALRVRKRHRHLRQQILALLIVYVLNQKRRQQTIRMQHSLFNRQQRERTKQLLMNYAKPNKQ